MADKILVVDDELNLLQALRRSLELESYQVVSASDGQEALRVFYSERPDLLILDVMMPGMDGWQVCRRVREMSDVPIIILTAKVEKNDVVHGFSLGADDYITKPFHLKELLARVRVALRRTRSEAHTSQKVIYSDDYLSIDLDARQVSVNGKPVKLTPTEYKLLALLVESGGQTLEFHHILESIWGTEYLSETDYVRTYIWQLRRKLEPDPKNPRYLLTELNVGYRFELE